MSEAVSDLSWPSVLGFIAPESKDLGNLRERIPDVKTAEDGLLPIDGDRTPLIGPPIDGVRSIELVP